MAFRNFRGYWGTNLLAIAMIIFLIPQTSAFAGKNQTDSQKMSEVLQNHEAPLYGLIKSKKIKSFSDSDGDGIIDYFDNNSTKSIVKTFKVKAIKPFIDEFNLSLEIPKDRLNFYQRLNLPEIKKDKNFSYLATANDPVLSKIVENLGDLYLQNYYQGNKYYLLHTILEIGRNIRYESDSKISKNGEYWKFPVETLASGSGDCEDIVLLLAGLFKNAGFNVILVDFKTHIGLGLALDPDLLQNIYGDHVPLDSYELNGIKYYYLETTSLDSYLFGEVPDKFKGIKPQLYEVK